MWKIVASLGLLLLLFQNCGEGVGFTSEGLVNGSTETPLTRQDVENISGSAEDLETIGKLCDQAQVYQNVIAVDFPKPSQTCDWGKNGNLDKRNQYLQARIEQKRTLNLPSGAVICDAKFDFVQQDFLYDDHFMLTFNDSIIASSYNFSSRLDKGQLGLLQYDWTKMAGMFWENSHEEIFCPQIPGFGASCSFPGHDQQGVINLQYDSQYIQAIMSNGVPENHFFKMVSVGDNDTLDCEHSDVSFDVTVRYVVPQ